MSTSTRTAAARTAPNKLWNWGFIMLIVVNLTQSLGTFMAINIIPLYARGLGAPASMIGFITGAFAVTALAVRPFSGPAFDSFSKKWLFFIATVLCFVATFGYAFTSSVIVLILLRFVNGVGVGCCGPLGMALASEQIPEGRMSSGIGFFTIATAISQAFGPALGIELSQRWGYAPAFLTASAFIAVGALLLALFVHDAPDAPRLPYKIALNRIFARQAVVPAVVLGLLSMSFACTNSFMAIYGGLRQVGGIGLYFTVYALCLLVTRPLFGHLSDKYGTTKVAVPAMCCFAASFIIVSRSSSLAGFVAAALVAGCGFGATTPLMQSLMFKCVPHTYRGAGSNTTYTGQDAGQLLGPFLAGVVIDALVPVTGSEVAAYSTMWLVMLIPIVAGIVVYLACQPLIKRTQAETAAAEAAARQTAEQKG